MFTTHCTIADSVLEVLLAWISLSSVQAYREWRPVSGVGELDSIADSATQAAPRDTLWSCAVSHLELVLGQYREMLSQALVGSGVGRTSMSHEGRGQAQVDLITEHTMKWKS